MRGGGLYHRVEKEVGTEGTWVLLLMSYSGWD